MQLQVISETTCNLNSQSELVLIISDNTLSLGEIEIDNPHYSQLESKP